MKVWRALNDGEIIYPVKCAQIASALNIHTAESDIDDDFEAALILDEDGDKFIIYNKRIKEDGRKNFSIAHELGHYSLHLNIKSIQCSLDSLQDMAPHPKNIEQEANLFAITLLMPADDVRKQILDRDLGFSTVKSLAERYETSLTASALRFIELLSAKKMAAVGIVKEGIVKWCSSSKGMLKAGCWIKKNTNLPGVLPLSDAPVEADIEIWFPNRYIEDIRLFISCVSMTNYEQELVLFELCY